MRSKIDFKFLRERIDKINVLAERIYLFNLSPQLIDWEKTASVPLHRKAQARQ